MSSVHSLSCRKSAGRVVRPSDVNGVIKAAGRAGEVLCRLNRDDVTVLPACHRGTVDVRCGMSPVRYAGV